MSDKAKLLKVIASKRKKPLSKKQRKRNAWKKTVARGKMYEDSYLPG